MTQANRQWLIAERPEGREVRESDFQLTTGEARAPKPGEVLVKVQYLGFDPSLKGTIENRTTYAASTQTGQVVPGRGVGEVVASNAAGFEPGDTVFGFLGWQDHATVSTAVLEKGPRIDQPSAYLGVLGSTGLTAYLGLKKIGQPFPGDVMVVTGAAGATGSVAGQLGKMAGCKVIGIAGGAEKCAWLVDELGFDAAIDYRKDDVGAAIKQHAPAGIDIIWDNVGGDVLDVLLARIANNARVVLCGAMVRYSTDEVPAGPKNYFNLVLQRATMEGFILNDWRAEFPPARARLARWFQEGRLKHREDVQQGLENAPKTFTRLFTGDNIGKQILKVV